jgi:hypothetical protein
LNSTKVSKANDDRCDKGHLLVYMEKPPIKTDPGYSEGFVCSICDIHVQIDGVKNGLKHCKICQYDLCPKCFGKSMDDKLDISMISEEKNFFCKTQPRSAPLWNRRGSLASCDLVDYDDEQSYDSEDYGEDGGESDGEGSNNTEQVDSFGDGDGERVDEPSNWASQSEMSDDRS